MSSIIFFFFFLAHSAVCCLIISLLWRFAGPPCIIYLCFSCVALFGPRVRGWNKADPHFEADRVSKVWTWGQHLPSLPAQPQPDRGRVRQRCSLLQASVGGGRNTTGRVIWCFFDPLRPLRWKGFQFLPDKEDHFSTEPLRASKLSRIFNRRQITVYCGVCYAPSPRPERAKGQK